MWEVIFMIYKDMIAEKDRLERSIASKEQQIKGLPKGRLQCYSANNGERYRWFVAQEGKSKKRKYLSRDDEDTAMRLATKGFIQAELKDERQKLAAVNRFIKTTSAHSHSAAYIERNSEYRRLAKPYLDQLDNDIQKWLAIPNTGNPNRSGGRNYMTVAGFSVSSKSEQIIVAKLIERRIPFKYEVPTYIDAEEVYPDFMIMHPTTHKLYMWEHLGMMDSPRYRSHNLWKIGQYAKIGFIPGDNLILTFETDTSGCDELLIEYIIEHYFA